MMPAHTSRASGVSLTQRKALTAAAQWMTQLGAADADAADHRAWQSWHQAHPANQWAWSRVQALQNRLREMPGALSVNALQLAHTQRAQQVVMTRRAVLKGAGALALTGWLGYELLPWQELRADFHTGIGETRRATLPDGSQITLDTHSAVRVAFDAGQRQLQLLSGEVLIESAMGASPSHRPLSVLSAQGEVQTLGARFSVRQEAQATRVVVLQDSVDVRARAHSTSALHLKAGQQTRLSQQTAATPRPADESLIAWAQGRLVISDWRLADFVSELNRYRKGWLRCDPRIGDLRISGAFPLRDTDAALRAVQSALPVIAQYRSAYWVTLRPL